MCGFNGFSSILAFGLLLTTAAGQAQVHLDWAQTFESGAFSTAVAVDRSGNVVVTGTGGSNDLDIVTVKYDSNGNVLWSATYGGSRLGQDYPWAITTDNDGNVYVAGELYTLGSIIDMVVLKYASAGNLVWAALYDSSVHGIESASAIRVDGTGNVYVTGVGHGLDGSLDAITVKFDPSGNQLWDALYGDRTGQVDRGNDLVVDDAGNVYVVGSSQGTNHPAPLLPGAFYYDGIIIKYDANGTQLWMDRYDNANHGDDSFNAIALDSTGAPLVAAWGRIREPNTFEFVTLKYNAAGQRLWTAFHPAGPERVGGQYLAVDSAGNAYVGGGALQTLKYNANGELQWAAELGGESRGLVLDDSGVYAAGIVYEPKKGSFHIDVAKYDSSGDLLWKRSYKRYGRTTESASALAVDTTGNVFVSGWTYPSQLPFSSADFLLLKLTQP